MTFAELAAARGIGKDSAITLVRRHGWRRQRDNQGHVIALVPLTWAEPEGEGRADNPLAGQPDSQPDTPADRTVLAGALAALEDALMTANARADEAGKRAETALARADRTLAQLADATERTAQAEHRAGAAQQRADRVEAAIDGERKRADRAEYRADGLRGRVDELEVNLGAARAEAQQATETAAALTRDEVARKARGRLRRVWQAWKGV
jgi:hypothetical protein